MTISEAMTGGYGSKKTPKFKDRYISVIAVFDAQKKLIT
jgi:hypothetical protein